MTSRRAHDAALGVALAISLVLFLVPQLLFMRQSLYENLGMGMTGDQASLGNYAEILTDGFYAGTFLKTVLLSAAAALTGLVAAFPTAYFLARLQSPLVRWLILLLLVTSFVTIVVKVLGLSLLLGSNGPIAGFLRWASFGTWRGSLLHNEFAVVVGLVQYTLPMMVLLVHGVVQGIPRSIEEAAQLAGASDLRLLWRILLPLALPGVLTAGLIAFNMNMGAFTSAVLLGGGNVLTLPVLIQRKVILEADYPNAAALSVLLTITVVAINLAIFWVRFLSRRRRVVVPA